MKGAPRVCGDDPRYRFNTAVILEVLPAYAGMIRRKAAQKSARRECSPRMRG